MNFELVEIRETRVINYRKQYPEVKITKEIRYEWDSDDYGIVAVITDERNRFLRMERQKDFAQMGISTEVFGRMLESLGIVRAKLTPGDEYYAWKGEFTRLGYMEDDESNEDYLILTKGR